jgi:vesicle transport through interaction with t-SNAREs protein 1
MLNVNDTDKNTMSKLKEQTDILNNASGKLNSAESYTDRSEGLIKNMIKRVFTNKLVLFGIIILLVLLNTFLLYIKIKYKLLGYTSN